MKIYVVGSSKNKFLPLDDIREKFLIDEKHEGDNIDFLNPWYCELTGLYYLWKHVDDDIVGLEHYRRYFVNEKGELLGENEIKNLLQDYDVIAHTSKQNNSRFRMYDELDICNKNGAIKDCYYKFLCAIKYTHPELMDKVDEMMKRKWHWQLNMGIMRKEILDDYCQFAFGMNTIFLEAFDIKDFPLRSLGYIFEILIWGLFLESKHLKVLDMNVKVI